MPDRPPFGVGLDKRRPTALDLTYPLNADRDHWDLCFRFRSHQRYLLPRSLGRLPELFTYQIPLPTMATCLMTESWITAGVRRVTSGRGYEGCLRPR